MFVTITKNPNYLDSKIETIEIQVVQVSIVLVPVVATKDMEEIVRNHLGKANENEALKTLLNIKDDNLVISTRKIVEVIEKIIEVHEDIGMVKAKVVLVMVKVVDDPDFQITMQVGNVKNVETNIVDETEAPNRKDEVKNYLLSRLWRS